MATTNQQVAEACAACSAACAACLAACTACMEACNNLGEPMDAATMKACDKCMADCEAVAATCTACEACCERAMGQAESDIGASDGMDMKANSDQLSDAARQLRQAVSSNPLTAKDQAEKEWADNADGCNAAFASQQVYVFARVRELTRAR